MEYAIIKSGGKQYKAVPGNTIEVDRLPIEVGEKVTLDQVLFHKKENDITVGKPTIKGAKVQATVVAQIKAPKIVVFKYKPKNRYRVKSGHRQRYTRLQIDKIQKRKTKKAAKKSEPESGSEEK